MVSDGADGAFLTEDLPALVAFIDTERRYRYVNRAFEEFFQRPKAEMCGKTILEVAGAEHHAVAEPYIRRVLQGELVSFASALRRADGMLRDIEAAYRPRRDEQGAVCGFISLIRDVTERSFLSEARLRLAAIVDSSDDAIVSKTLDGVITSWNRAAEKMYGYTAAEAVGKHITLIIPPERWGEEDEVLRRLRRGEKIDHFETERRAKDGRKVYVSLTVSPIRDARGDLIGASKIARDITQRKLDEEALRASEEQFSTLANTIPNLAWMAHADGHIFWYNRRWYEYTGTTPEQMEGWGWQSVHDPDVLPAVLGNWKQSLATGEPFEMTFPLKGADGRFRSFLTRVEPIKNVRGEVLRWFGTNTDITALREAEEREKRSRETAELLNRIGPLLAAELDAGRLAQKITDIAAEAVRAECGALFHVARDEAGQRMVHRMSGRLARLPVRSHLTAPVRSRTGEAIGGLFFGHSEPGAFNEESAAIAKGIAAQAAIALDNARLFDETRRAAEALRRSNETLKRLNDDLNQFAFSASHDLREPLRIVSIYTQLLERKLEDKLDAETREYMDHVLKATARLEALIRDLLAYTQAANAPAPAEAIDAGEALDRALFNLETALKKAGANVSVSRLPRVKIAPVHLTQLLQNLIGNAVKYRGAAPPEIRVGARRREDGWEFFVADNGIGIEPEYKEQIFGVFKRLHLQDEYSGTGIGLAICQRIVQRAGGRIWVESEPGKGSTFYFTLPAGE